VAEWYVRHGFEIVARNWRCTRGELDVVARRGRMLVVCEVKARADDTWGSGLEAVTARKQLRIRRATAEMIASLGLRGVHIRFDVAAVTGVHLDVVTDAF
jgi:putative endonuclease